MVYFITFLILFNYDYNEETWFHLNHYRYIDLAEESVSIHYLREYILKFRRNWINEEAKQKGGMKQPKIYFIIERKADWVNDGKELEVYDCA